MDRISDHPVHIDIDLSSKCNLRCGFCHLSHFDPKDSTQVSYGQFVEWIGPVLGNLDAITLFSKFEPLVCRDFVPIFNEVCKHDVETYFSTNGVLLDEAIIDAIVGRLTYLTVSVTGFTRKKYAKYMGVDALEKVEKNLNVLNGVKERKRTSFPILRISTVAMSETFDEMSAAVDFAETHKAGEGVQVTSLIAYNEDMVMGLPVNDPQNFSRAAKAARRNAEAKGVKFTLQSGSLEESESMTCVISHKPCRIPWLRLSIQPNGDVFPCPVAYESVGNLNDASLIEIWKGEALERFRAGVNDAENMNQDCRICTHCRHRSISRETASDFSNATNHYAGMTRKTPA